MATEVIRYVDPDSSGGNGTTNALSGANAAYASLSAWNAARARDITSATGDNTIERVICCSNGASHTADTTQLVMAAGWVTSTTNYIQIEAEVSHGGSWNTSVYRFTPTISVNNDGGIIISTNAKFMVFDGLQIGVIQGNASNQIDQFSIASNATWSHKFRNLLIKGTYIGGSDNDCICTHAAGGTGTVYVYNCILHSPDFGSNQGSAIYSAGTSYTWYVYNNTFIAGAHGNSYGINNTTASYTVKAINNLFTGYSGGRSAAGGAMAGSGYNATTDSSIGYTVSGGSTGDRLSQTFSFVDANNGDFHLKSDDPGAKGHGLTDPGSGLFSDDIDGQTRSAPWDIGADQYVAAVSAAVTGTATASITEADVVAGGKTIIISLSGDTFVPS
jgi:hypothetical protein